MRYLFLLSLFLVSCAAGQQAPAYLVRVGSPYTWRCGGYAIDERHIVTADHCGSLTLAQISDGTDVGMMLVARWPEIDTALYETAVALQLDAYATLQPIAPGQVAYAFGYCPLWDSTIGRLAYYTTTEAEPLHCHEMRIDTGYICSGDSGGIIVQDGAVVGMISKFRGNAFGLNARTTVAGAMCAVTGEAIAARVEKWREER